MDLRIYANVRVMVVAFFIFILLSPFTIVDAELQWLKEGAYATYRLGPTYILRGWGPDGPEVEAVGGGRYRWEVVEVRGRLAVLNVSLRLEKLSRSVLVTIDVETMDLIEDGRVWGKAWLWINLARIPASYPDNIVVRNITIVMNWLNRSLENPRVSRIYSSSKEGGLGKMARTGLGYVDKVVTMSIWHTGLTRLICIRDGRRETRQFIPELRLGWSYEVKCGLLIGGLYLDDILTQKFGVVFYDDPSPKTGEYIYAIMLEDTNMEIGVEEAGFDPILILKKHYVYILLGVLAALFLATFVRCRPWER